MPFLKSKMVSFLASTLKYAPKVRKSVPSKFNFCNRLSKQVKYDAGCRTKCLYVSVAKYSILLKVSGFISGEGFI